jgi:hypothetical protein
MYDHTICGKAIHHVSYLETPGILAFGMLVEGQDLLYF